MSKERWKLTARYRDPATGHEGQTVTWLSSEDLALETAAVAAGTAAEHGFEVIEFIIEGYFVKRES